MSFPEFFKHIPNKDFSTYTFDVLVSNKALFLELLKKLDESIDEKANIPPGLLIDLKNLIVPGGYNKHLENQSRIAEINEKAVTYFSTVEGEKYLFEGMAKSTESEGAIELYSLHNMFLPIIIEYFNHKDERDYLDKDFVLEHFYKQIRNYKDSLSNQEINLANFGHYKIAVMAAFLTKSVGFRICNKPKPTHAELYQASRNRLDKLQH